MDGDKLALLSFTENLGYLWPFGVGFIEKSLSVFERDLFEKKSAKNKFLVLVKKVYFLAFQIFGGNAQLCRTVVSKPLDPQMLIEYHWKDNIRSFQLVPCGTLCDR